MKPSTTGVNHIVHATRYSWLGFRAAWRHESAFRQELALFLIGIPVAALVAATPVEFLLLTLPLCLLLLTELLNSAIETVVDRISQSHDELSGRAKDMGSAAVFTALCILGLAWLTILSAKLWQWS